jgi:hypothetical protein
MYYGQVLKTHTREVLYEKFRTEKLLARRATRKIGEEQTKKLLQGVFSPPSSHPLLSTNATRRSRVVKFHSGWFRIWSRSNLDTVTTSPYLCMLTHFPCASSYYHLLFWVHSRYPWLTWLVRLILISFSYSIHLMSLLPCRCCIHFPSDVWH